MTVDAFVKEIQVLAQKHGITMRVLQVHRPSRTQTIEIQAPPATGQKPLLSPHRDWRQVG